MSNKFEDEIEVLRRDMRVFSAREKATSDQLRDMKTIQKAPTEALRLEVLAMVRWEMAQMRREFEKRLDILAAEVARLSIENEQPITLAFTLPADGSAVGGTGELESLLRLPADDDPA